MCIALPGKIVSIAAYSPLPMAQVDFGGVIKEICISTVDAAIGDYVIAHAGFAIAILDETAAISTVHDLHLMVHDTPTPQ